MLSEKKKDTLLCKHEGLPSQFKASFLSLTEVRERSRHIPLRRGPCRLGMFLSIRSSSLATICWTAGWLLPGHLGPDCCLSPKTAQVWWGGSGRPSPPPPPCGPQDLLSQHQPDKQAQFHFPNNFIDLKLFYRSYRNIAKSIKRMMVMRRKMRKQCFASPLITPQLSLDNHFYS